jgi:hypothetical protein
MARPRRRASEAMLKRKARHWRRIRVCEDKAYDTSDHVVALRAMNITPHVAQNDSLYRPQFLGHRFEPYAAATTEGSCF